MPERSHGPLHEVARLAQHRAARHCSGSFCTRWLRGGLLRPEAALPSSLSDSARGGSVRAARSTGSLPLRGSRCTRGPCRTVPHQVASRAVEAALPSSFWPSARWLSSRAQDSAPLPRSLCPRRPASALSSNAAQRALQPAISSVMRAVQSGTVTAGWSAARHRTARLWHAASACPRRPSSALSKALAQASAASHSPSVVPSRSERDRDRWMVGSATQDSAPLARSLCLPTAACERSFKRMPRSHPSAGGVKSAHLEW